MSSQRLGGGNPHFDPGEAEAMVQELRNHLREEQRLRRTGDFNGAATVRSSAVSLVESLTQRLERRFERYARAKFSNWPELIEDAVSEMFAELCRRLQDTSSANELMERRFNFVVELLMIDAIRKVRRQNAMTKQGAPATEGYHLVSIEAAEEQALGAEGERGVTPLNVADPVAEESYERIIDQLLGQTALDWLHELPPRQRTIVECRVFAGEDWATVAARVGVTTKTAQTDLNRAVEALKARLDEGAHEPWSGN